MKTKFENFLNESIFVEKDDKILREIIFIIKKYNLIPTYESQTRYYRKFEYLIKLKDKTLSVICERGGLDDEPFNEYIISLNNEKLKCSKFLMSKMWRLSKHLYENQDGEKTKKEIDQIDQKELIKRIK